VSDQYVLTLRPTAGGDLDLSSLRGSAIADAYARFGRVRGDDVLFTTDLDSSADATIERWALWLLEQLDAAGLIYKRTGEGWRLRSGKLHAESERRLEELSGWSDAALAGQRELLKHVDDPGDSGDELEQSLSKLAAAGWKVDAKKDKGPPEVFFAAGDMPLARGEDWRAAGAVHPRLAAALALMVAAVPLGERDGEPAAQVGEVVRRLPAVAVAASGEDVHAALLDMRTIAKALRDVGALDLPSGEPLGRVLAAGEVRLRAAGKSASNGGDPAVTADPNDVATLTAVHGADAVRFALLHAAAPEKPFRGGEDVVGYAARFLTELRELATARLDGSPAGTRIDPADGLRRRLAGWCDTAVARMAENYERLDTHRATRNAIELLARIEDFDTRVTEQRGELAGADREAVAVALALLAQLLAPLAPSVADEIWRQAGRDGSAADAAWPSAQREPAAA
jgi:Anticodon-binding domain of tRNA ligase